MRGYRVIGLLTLCYLHTLADASCDILNSGIGVKNVDRTVDITTQLVKVYHRITFESTADEPVHSFLFSVESDVQDHLAFLRAQVGNLLNKTPLKFVKKKVTSHPEKHFWCIDFKDALQPSKTAVVEVDLVFSHQLFAYPETIKQKDKQLILYCGNHYFYSPYATTKQLTKVNFGTRNIESYTRLEPVSQVNSVISYGPYEKVAPFTVDKMAVHYENNAQFLTVTSLERVIEVSHWGNIAVEETIYLEHTGAKLKGPFSRYDYVMGAQGRLSSVKSFKTILPASATDVYYRDEIGNISTSYMKVMSDCVEIELHPRFPLFGGWKTIYVIGYNVPTYEYLYNAGDSYLLTMRLVDHIYNDMMVDELTVKIILPEGSTNTELSTPYPVKRWADSLHFTYLDTTGRPVITLSKKNLVEDHIEEFELLYNFSRVMLFQEPLLIVAAFYIMFIFITILVRLDFSITKEEPAGQSHEKINLHQTKSRAKRSNI